MAVPARNFQANSYYHVYNRGNRKQAIFTNYRDYERFLEKVVEYKKKYSIQLLAYCLMPNHFHFLIYQSSPNDLSKFISDLCNSHSRYFNVKYGLIGTLFQGRFKAKLVEKDEYLIHLSRYIHLNPVDLFPFAGKELWERVMFYKWSSLFAYLSNKNNNLVSVEQILGYFSPKDPVSDYKKFVESNIELKIEPVIESLIFNENN
jgi:REP element-mobilizing transposase RayT